MTDIHIGRRTFIKKTAAAAAAVTFPGIIAPAATGIGRRNTAGASASTGNLIVPKAEGLKITGTFLDEISHDIPHQNWGALFDGIHDVVDARAFQDGHLFDRYKEYFGIR